MGHPKKKSVHKTKHKEDLDLNKALINQLKEKIVQRIKEKAGPKKAAQIISEWINR